MSVFGQRQGHQHYSCSSSVFILITSSNFAPDWPQAGLSESLPPCSRSQLHQPLSGGALNVRLRVGQTCSPPPGPHKPGVEGGKRSWANSWWGGAGGDPQEHPQPVLSPPPLPCTCAPSEPQAPSFSGKAILGPCQLGPHGANSRGLMRTHAPHPELA